MAHLLALLPVLICLVLMFGAGALGWVATKTRRAAAHQPERTTRRSRTGAPEDQRNDYGERLTPRPGRAAGD